MAKKLSIAKLAKSVSRDVEQGVNSVIESAKVVNETNKAASIISNALKNAKASEGKFSDNEANKRLSEIIQLLSNIEKSVKKYKHGRILNIAIAINRLDSMRESVRNVDNTDLKNFLIGHINPEYVSAITALENAANVLRQCEAESIVQEFRLGDMTFSLPMEFEKLYSSKSACHFIWIGDNSYVDLTASRVNDNYIPLDLDNVETNIERLKNELSESDAIIDCKVGVSKDGHKYAYTICKTIDTSTGISKGAEYYLTINIEIDGVLYDISGRFIETGITGSRESTVMLALYTKAKEEKENLSLVEFAKNKWSCDFYNTGRTEGIMMNLSELEQYDKKFPNHPLTICRSVKDCILTI